MHVHPLPVLPAPVAHRVSAIARWASPAPPAARSATAPPPAAATDSATGDLSPHLFPSANGCDCLVGFFGDRCNHTCLDETHCNAHGHCARDGGCLCDDGFDGPDCSLREGRFATLAVWALLIVNGVIAVCWYRQRVGVSSGCHVESDSLRTEIACLRAFRHV